MNNNTNMDVMANRILKFENDQYNAESQKRKEKEMLDEINRKVELEMAKGKKANQPIMTGMSATYENPLKGDSIFNKMKQRQKKA